MTRYSKEQAIGFLFYAFMENGTTRLEMRDVHHFANLLIDKGYKSIDLCDISKILQEIGEHLNLTLRRKHDIYMSIEDAFEKKTIGEVEHLHDLYHAAIFV